MVPIYILNIYFQLPYVVDTHRSLFFNRQVCNFVHFEWYDFQSQTTTSAKFFLHAAEVVTHFTHLSNFSYEVVFFYLVDHVTVLGSSRFL